MILIHPPIYWYVAISILASATAYKLEVLGNSWIPYFVTTFILVILALLPAWKGVNRDEKIRQEIR